VSAGGLLIGAAVNLRPELFKSIILLVPFLDLIKPLKDKNLPLTVHEYDEWGDVNDLNVLKYIESYSPYNNLSINKKYSNFYITTSINDFRVPFWIPLKYVAKLRNFNNYDSIYFKINDTGHYDESAGNNANFSDILDIYSFILYTLGIK
jgi:oligopeptidase B